YLKIMAAGGTAWNPGWHVGWQVLLAWAEFVAGVAILFGFRCRIAAGVLVLVTSVVLAWGRGRRSLEMPLQNIELVFLLLLAALALLCFGAGEVSIDARGRKKPARKA